MINLGLIGVGALVMLITSSKSWALGAKFEYFEPNVATASVPISRYVRH